MNGCSRKGKQCAWILGKAESSLFSSSLGAGDFLLFHTEVSTVVRDLLFCSESHQKVRKD